MDQLIQVWWSEVWLRYDKPDPVRTTALVVASSKIIALMLREHRIASLSTRFPSSKLQLRADSTIHMSHMLILHARKWARFSGVAYVQIHTFDNTAAWQHTNTTACTASTESGRAVFVRFSLGGGSEFRLAYDWPSDYSGHGGCQIGKRRIVVHKYTGLAKNGIGDC